MSASSHTHHPRKRFGQHFLHDTSVLTNIVANIAPNNTEHLVEIGPGQGALTECLLPYVARLDAIEIDRDLVTRLEKQFIDNKNFFLHQHDALTFELKTLSDATCRVVGNLPYNISTPLLFHLFNQIDFIQDMHFLLQKEVVERLTAEVGSHHYSRLSVMAQYFCDNTDLFDVRPEAFTPPPKVQSAFVRLVPHQQPQTAKNFLQFSQVVQQAFNYRRKTLSNSLRSLIDPDKLEAIGIDPKLRPQVLSVADFIRISDAISVE